MSGNNPLLSFRAAVRQFSVQAENALNDFYDLMACCKMLKYYRSVLPRNKSFPFVPALIPLPSPWITTATVNAPTLCPEQAGWDTPAEANMHRDVHSELEWIYTRDFAVILSLAGSCSALVLVPLFSGTFPWVSWWDSLRISWGEQLKRLLYFHWNAQPLHQKCHWKGELLMCI